MLKLLCTLSCCQTDTHPHDTSKESIKIDMKLEFESAYVELKLKAELIITDKKLMVVICRIHGSRSRMKIIVREEINTSGEDFKRTSGTMFSFLHLWMFAQYFSSLL
jgi:hypothetical protein